MARVPKKLGAKSLPEGPEFKGRDVWKHTKGDDAATTLSHISILGQRHPNDFRMHAGGYYSIPAEKKPKKAAAKKPK